jgi:Domain of unknown function (DUF4160)
MPVIVRLSNHRVRICMYPDHAPPHFHLLGPGWSAQINLQTLQVMRGSPPAQYLAECVEWAVANKPLLISEWESLNERDD